MDETLWKYSFADILNMAMSDLYDYLGVVDH